MGTLLSLKIFYMNFFKSIRVTASMKWVLFGRLITSISSIVSNVVIIRVLGVNDVSAYFLFLSFVSLVGVFLQ